MTSTSGPDLLQRIGGTPVVELSKYSTNKIKFYAKLEWYNPFGSVKDRPAYWMVKEAEKSGVLKKGKSIIIEPTSGNTGIATNRYRYLNGLQSRDSYSRKGK